MIICYANILHFFTQGEMVKLWKFVERVSALVGFLQTSNPTLCKSIWKCSKTQRGRLCIPSKKKCRVKNIAMLQYLNKNILSNLQDIPQSCIDPPFLFPMALCPCINIVFQNLSRSIPADQSLTITPSPVADLPPHPRDQYVHAQLHHSKATL